MGSVNPQKNKENPAKAGVSSSLTGFGAVARPGLWGSRAIRIVQPTPARPLPTSFGPEGRSQGSTSTGQSKTHSQKLLGPRISHIGQGAISNVYMLTGLNTGQSTQAQLFNPKDTRSQARQTGRPLGYGTVYKLF